MLNGVVRVAAEGRRTLVGRGAGVVVAAVVGAAVVVVVVVVVVEDLTWFSFRTPRFRARSSRLQYGLGGLPQG